MTLNEWANAIYAYAEKKGWNKNFYIPEKLLLIHTEISEATEELRNNRTPKEIYFHANSDKPEGFPVELADAMIRILHIFAHIGVEPEKVIDLKMAYNYKRSYRHGNKRL